MSDRKPIIRKDFISASVRAGLTYAQAKVAYDATIRIMEEAIMHRRKVYFGNVFSIVPVEKPPRAVHKNFTSTKEVYFIGRRFEFKVNVFKKFFDSHQLNWF